MPDAGQRERGDGSFFLGKKKEPKKNRLGLSSDAITYIRFRGYGFFIREAARIADLTRLLAMSQRRGLTRSFLLSHGSLSGAFRDTANRVRFFRQVAPAARSPPRKRGGSFLFRGAFHA